MAAILADIAAAFDPLASGDPLLALATVLRPFADGDALLVAPVLDAFAGRDALLTLALFGRPLALGRALLPRVIATGCRGAALLMPLRDLAPILALFGACPHSRTRLGLGLPAIGADFGSGPTLRLRPRLSTVGARTRTDMSFRCRLGLAGALLLIMGGPAVAAVLILGHGGYGNGHRRRAREP